MSTENIKNDEKLLSILLSLKDKCSAAEEEIQKDLGLSAAEYRGLMCLKPEEKISCQELTVRMFLSVSRGSRVIEKLFQNGYINRKDCFADKRSKNIWLTPKGIGIQKKITRFVQDCEEKLVSNVPPSKLKRLKSDLKDLAQKF